MSTEKTPSLTPESGVGGTESTPVMVAENTSPPTIESGPQIPEPAPVVVAPTFATSLQTAMADFVETLASLKSGDLGMDSARDAKTTAQAQLNKAQTAEMKALGSRTESYESAGAARDILVAVLQAWR